MVLEVLNASGPEEVPDSLSQGIELLESFLEKVNFAHLRARYPDLDGRRKVFVSIEKTVNSEFLLKWDRGEIRLGVDEL